MQQADRNAGKMPPEIWLFIMMSCLHPFHHMTNASCLHFFWYRRPDRIDKDGHQTLFGIIPERSDTYFTQFGWSFNPFDPISLLWCDITDDHFRDQREPTLQIHHLYKGFDRTGLEREFTILQKASRITAQIK